MDFDDVADLVITNLIGSGIPRIVDRVINAFWPSFAARSETELLERVQARSASTSEQKHAREVVLRALREDENARQVVQETFEREPSVAGRRTAQEVLAFLTAMPSLHPPWSAAHKVFRESWRCPIGGESLRDVTYANASGAVHNLDGADRTVTAQCERGHSWRVYR